MLKLTTHSGALPCNSRIGNIWVCFLKELHSILHNQAVCLVLLGSEVAYSVVSYPFRLVIPKQTT